MVYMYMYIRPSDCLCSSAKLSSKRAPISIWGTALSMFYEQHLAQSGVYSSTRMSLCHSYFKNKTKVLTISIAFLTEQWNLGYCNTLHTKSINQHSVFPFLLLEVANFNSSHWTIAVKSHFIVSRLNGESPHIKIKN